MKLQIEIRDLRRMLKEKCEEIISDKKLAYEFYWRICDIEEDDRFTIIEYDNDGEREKIIKALENAKKQSEENAQGVIIVPFKEVNIILSMLKEEGVTNGSK